jgi:hypothetical protein
VSSGEVATRPPFYHLAIKDPYGVENIARNLDAMSVAYVKDASRAAADCVLTEIKDAAFLVDTLTGNAPTPVRGSVNQGAKPMGDGDGQSSEPGPGSSEFEARRLLAQGRFHQRKDKMRRFGESSVEQNVKVRAAQDLTKSMVGWLKTASRK